MILKDIPYSSKYKDKRLMDIYMPENKSDICLFFIHGGGWWCGDKKSWHETALYFYSKNYTCVTINYRLVPEYTFPAQVEDARLAISYVKYIQGLFEPPDKIIAIGSSAGGHLAAMLATINTSETLGDSDELKFYATRPDAAVCLCPITKVGTWDNCSEKITPMMYNFIGKCESEDPVSYKTASPIYRIKGDEPPFLFIHGDSDDVIPLWHSIDMYNKLTKSDLNKMVILKNVAHGFGYGVRTESQIRTLDEIDQFVIYLKQHWISVKI